MDEVKAKKGESPGEMVKVEGEKAKSPGETGVKLMVKGENNVETSGQKGESKVKLVIKGEKVVVFDGGGVKPGEKPVITGESEVDFSGSSKPPQSEWKGEKLNFENANKVSIPAFLIKLVLFFGIVAVLYWKRKEVRNFIKTFFEKEEDEYIFSHY